MKDEQVLEHMVDIGEKAHDYVQAMYKLATAQTLPASVDPVGKPLIELLVASERMMRDTPDLARQVERIVWEDDLSSP